jgi:hypothetical protein
MKKHLISLVVALAAVVGAVVATAGASAQTGETQAGIGAVRLSLGGSPVAMANSFRLTGQSDGARRRSFVLELERGLTRDGSLVSVFSSGETFGTGALELLDSAANVLATYALTEVSVRSFVHEASARTAVERVVLTAGSVRLQS